MGPLLERLVGPITKHCSNGRGGKQLGKIRRTRFNMTSPTSAAKPRAPTSPICIR